MRLWWWLVLVPTVALAKTESWPRQYNTGVTAYRSNDFSQASQLFENATSSKDRILQQRALYNLGNADFRLGQTQPQQAQQLWQRALKSYESALAIDPKDADAKFNYEFVKKQLEELKKQQQQQQQNQQNQKKDQQHQNQEQQQQQSEKNQQNKDQSQKQDQQQQNQKQGQPQQKAEDKQSAEQQKQQQKPGERQQEQQAQAEQQQQEANGQPQDMDKMQATEMLDNLREDERDWNFFPEVQMKDLKDSGEPAKDW
jgi:Ca-activated chloride channel family protein